MTIRVLKGEPGEQRLLAEFEDSALGEAMQYAAERFDWMGRPSRIWVEYDRGESGNYPWVVEVREC